MDCRTDLALRWWQYGVWKSTWFRTPSNGGYQQNRISNRLTTSLLTWNNLKHFKLYPANGGKFAQLATTFGITFHRVLLPACWLIFFRCWLRHVPTDRGIRVTQLPVCSSQTNLARFPPAVPCPWSRGCVSWENFFPRKKCLQSHPVAN